MIAILSVTDDPHADAVQSILDGWGQASVRVDFTAFPAPATGGVRLGSDGLVHASWTTAGGDVVDLLALTAVWWRRPGRVTATTEFVATEASDFVDDVWDLAGLPALPAARPVVERAQKKIRQLQLAAQLGFELPPTLVTNDPDQALDFVRATNGHAVSKQVGFADVARAADGEPGNWNAYVRYTERVTHRDLAHIEALRRCPVILQAEVAKRHELRVTVVGDDVFAVAIHSQQNPRTSLDWRRYDDARTLHEIVSLPADVAERCVQMTSALGLGYAAFDLIVTHDDRHVFVEVNPNGQYLWLEQLTGIPISEAVAAYLVSGLRSTKSPNREDHRV
jgi:RimK-like ATP-grasp domain